MASSGLRHVKDIDEKFCQCPVCLQQYRKPKLLPCLHRYCSDCLKQLIERNQGVTVINCPECRDEVTIPTEGVDGFKTDFYMENIIEYIQIQKSLEDETLRECYGCSKRLNVTSYCFKCNGLLCKGCYEFHMNNKILKDHKQNVLSLEDLKSKHMTLEKLANLKEPPRCQSHLNDVCLLCCRTCKELPICVACVHGKHRDHDINDVEIVADEERKKLQNEIKNLNQYKERMMKMRQEVDRVKKRISSKLRKRKGNSTTRYERDMQTVKREIEKIEEDYFRSKTEIEQIKETELMKTKKEMDEEMKKISTKYDYVINEIEINSTVKLYNLRKEKEEKIEKNREQLAILEKEFESSLNIFAKEQNERLAKLEEPLQQIVSIIGRYENLTKTGYSVLETQNDWTAVQCIPNIYTAIGPLTRDIIKEFTELEILSRVGVGFEVQELDEESLVNIEGIPVEWKMTCVTGVDDGSIVVTGPHSPANYQSHITAINIDGKVLRWTELAGTFILAYRYCAYLSESKIATVCMHDEIGVFDLLDFSYVKKNIKDVSSSWPSDGEICCVTTDRVNNHILIGCYDSRDVYVFDDQLNYHYILTLSEMIKYPRDMAFSEGKLLVCDPKRAYIVTMENQGGKVTVAHELTKPDSERADWDPLNVSTDSKGFLYILWMTGTRLTAGKRVIVRYSPTDSQSLTQREILSSDARCIATLKTKRTETLLVTCWTSGKLHIYNLV